MRFRIRLILYLVACSSFSVYAQSSGQGTSVKMGVIDKAVSVTLQNTGDDAGLGAVAGGAIGYNVGGDKSNAKKRRHTVIGGALGAKAGSSGSAPGMEYTVSMVDGSSVVVVSDQVHLKAGDCVSIEQTGKTTNIREQDPAACNPAVKEALEDPVVEKELVEDADECAQAKQELLEAQTTEAVEIATAKARILCN